MLQGLGRPLQGDWETEGTIKELPDFHFRACFQSVLNCS